MQMRAVSKLDQGEITPYRTETANAFYQGQVARKCKLPDKLRWRGAIYTPKGGPGPGRGGGTGPGKLVGGEVANANRGAVSGAQDGGGGGDGSGLAGEGKGVASRMADAGNCGGDGGVVNVYKLSHGRGEPDGAPAGIARVRPVC